MSDIETLCNLTSHTQPRLKNNTNKPKKQDGACNKEERK